MRTEALAHKFIFSYLLIPFVFPLRKCSIILDLFFPFWAQLRRERIAERIRALQELVPSVNKVSVFSLMSFHNFLAEWGFVFHIVGKLFRISCLPLCWKENFE
jgi:hypothetical protein